MPLGQDNRWGNMIHHHYEAVVVSVVAVDVLNGATQTLWRLLLLGLPLFVVVAVLVALMMMMMRLKVRVVTVMLQLLIGEVDI